MSTPDDPKTPEPDDDPRGAPGSEPSGQGFDAAPGSDVYGGPDADEAAANAPRKRTGLFVGGGVAAVAVVVAVVFAVLYGTGSAPFNSSDDADIEAATTDYVNAFNSQKVADLKGSICSDDAGQLDGLQDGQGSSNPITVENVDGVSIDGSTATAKVTASAKTGDGKPDQETLTLGYKKEGDAWKVCPSLAPPEQAPADQGPAQQAPAPQAPPEQGN
ncbi:nuclear transport factor 2 family protein [Tomitella fengzijianii]|uniref:Nuclear transport factor 2 family protein n=1 Tax=Tomitella fengzijianii TaxID=2597660 RepID=A0A516X1S0_9ACTN|nr:nuclear transport factor 2 family protein [Tomitella fengzijianii]QDQ97019.1 nuclear transport factor 2 family protein [Tomitella fengzijianii]